MGDLKSFEGFVALDRQCENLLGEFYEWLKSPDGADLLPEKASPLAHEADRYLRDYLVEIRELPPEATSAETAAFYLGNWYIVNTLTPTHDEVLKIARSLALLHRRFGELGIIPRETAEAAIKVLEDAGRFSIRLEEFWSLTPENAAIWREGF